MTGTVTRKWFPSPGNSRRFLYISHLAKDSSSIYGWGGGKWGNSHWEIAHLDPKSSSLTIKPNLRKKTDIWRYCYRIKRSHYQPIRESERKEHPSTSTTHFQKRREKLSIVFTQRFNFFRTPTWCPGWQSVTSEYVSLLIWKPGTEVGYSSCGQTRPLHKFYHL